MVQNILYHYLVVLNVKIRIRFFGHLRALGTVRIFWKYELKRVKTSHALWCNRSEKSNPENSFLPENSNFLDVSVNILRTRTSYRVPLSQACSKRPSGHFELPKFYIHPVLLCSGQPQHLCKSTTLGPSPGDPPPFPSRGPSPFPLWFSPGRNWSLK